MKPLSLFDSVNYENFFCSFETSKGKIGRHHFMCAQLHKKVLCLL